MQSGRLIRWPSKPRGAVFVWYWIEAAELDIDVLGDGLLRTCYPAVRAALAQHLEQAIKKALAQQHECGAGYRLVQHEYDYRVEGEVGRFAFALFDVIDTEERPVFEGRCLLPPRQGRQWYQTCGFKELALLQGAAQLPPDGGGA
jgi:hypothetical protein